MKKKWIALLVMVALMGSLFGCRQEMPEGSVPTSTTPQTTTQPTGGEDTAPSTEYTIPLVTGSLLTSRLEVQPWDAGRCAQTTRTTMAETEQGYYYNYNGYLYYADKSNLTQWVPVCVNPECQHNEFDYYCMARIGGSEFILEDDRLISMGSAQYSDVGFSSRALDGTDIQEEFSFTQGWEKLSMGGGASRAIITPTYRVLSLFSMNQTGTYDYTLWTEVDGEEKLLFSTEVESFSSCSSLFNCNSDQIWFTDEVMDGESGETRLYRIEDGALHSLNITGLEIRGCYLDDQRALSFRAGDGYYQIDLETGQEQKLSDVQCEDCSAVIVRPNCIVESTLGWSSDRDKIQTHQLLVFDGQQWRSVALPEEIQQIGDTEILSFLALTSDRLLFTFYNSEEPYQKRKLVFYQVRLDADALVLEYAGKMQ